MRGQITNLILNFIRENPGAQIGEVVRGLPDVDRSSISSALCRLTEQGRVSRKTALNHRFSYRIAAGECIPAGAELVPDAAPAELPKREVISPEEWECRFRKAVALIEKGLTRRASQAFLELLDVTGEAKQREEIIRVRGRCGDRASGDGSATAGRFVGEGLV